jgi:hypothetical protein
MLIRHTGIFVQKIELIDSILLQLGFVKTYNEKELFNNEKVEINKYIYKGCKFEFIENSSRSRSNSFHICFDGNIPDFMLQYQIERFIPKDESLLVDFVYINDSVYFEFVRNKNEL